MHLRLNLVFLVTTICFSIGRALPADSDEIWVPRVGPLLPDEPTEPADPDDIWVPRIGGGPIEDDDEVADASRVVARDLSPRNEEDASSETPTSTPADDDDAYKITCNTDYWTYYYNWTPLIDYVCNWTADSLEKSWNGDWLPGEIWTGEAKKVALQWNLTGTNCQQTCRQAWTKLYTDSSCRAEDFWLREEGRIELEGCGVGSYNIYPDLDYPRLDHNTGLCWETPTPSTYVPDAAVTRRFCEAAVHHILEAGEPFTYGGEREGFYWTDYNRRVTAAGNHSELYDQGFVHFWIRGTRFKNVCGPGQATGEEVKKINVDQCVKHITEAESQPCGQPTGVTFGARLWADCFEWGTKASGYWGIKN